MQEETFAVEPTAIVRVDEEEGRLGAVTVEEGGEKALVVFRGPEDAFAYQRTSGKHTREEGFAVVGMALEAVAALLRKQGLGRVAMPEPWSGEGSVDFFRAEDFFALLEASPVE